MIIDFGPHVKKNQLGEYWDKLNRHDWYYMMSDDLSVYQSGLKNYTQLAEMITLGNDYRELFDAFNAYFFSKQFGFQGINCSKPERPE